MNHLQSDMMVIPQKNITSSKSKSKSLGKRVDKRIEKSHSGEKSISIEKNNLSNDNDFAQKILGSFRRLK